MRFLLWIALATVAAFLLLTFYHGESSATLPQQAAANEFSLSIISSELSDFGGGGSAAVLQLASEPPGGAIEGFCSKLPLPEKILLLDHAQSPGATVQLYHELSEKLSSCGLSPETISTQKAFLEEGAVIIAPAGAFPHEFVNASENFSARGVRLVVLEALEGRAIEQSGRIYPLETSQGWAQRIRLLPGGQEAAYEQALRAALFPPGHGAFPDLLQGRSAAFEVNASPVHCRLVRLTPSGCRFSDNGPLSLPLGRLSGPANITAGSEGVFEFSYNGSDGEEGRRLEFFAVAISGGKEVLRTQIGSGSMVEGWATAFKMKFPTGGLYVIRIADQFGRTHASALVEVRGLSARFLSRQNQRYDFELLSGGEMADGIAEAWIGSGQKKQFSVSGGKLSIYASPENGVRTLHIAHGGAETQLEVEFTGSSVAGTFLQLGVPALIFTLAVFLLLRTGKKSKYTITFPKQARAQPLLVRVEGKGLAAAWAHADKKNGGHLLLCTAEEIGASALELAGEKGSFANVHSASSALRRLALQGAFLECRGFFIPASQAGGFSPQELYCLRILHDFLLGQGIRFFRKKALHIPPLGMRFAPFSSKKSALGLLPGPTLVLLFADESSKDRFVGGLGVSDEDTLLKLAMANGKLALCVSSSKSLSELVP